MCFGGGSKSPKPTPAPAQAPPPAVIQSRVDMENATQPKGFVPKKDGQVDNTQNPGLTIPTA